MVLFLIEKGADFQASGGFGSADELQHCFIVDQGLAGPIAANESKHTVFDGIPFGGTGRINDIP